jgi:D-alanyl-D-alanine-carboxypeptidase/D-alanyl-D-alanine-endopeptidase
VRSPKSARTAARRARVAGLAAVFLPVALPGPSGAAQPADSTIRRIIVERVDAGLYRSIVVGVVDPDGARRAVAYGVRDAGGTPVDAQTVYEIGSVTKAFTGILLAEMAERGEVGLEDPLQAHLPEGVRVGVAGERPIRLVDLATHLSGLPRLPGNLNPPDLRNPYAAYTEDDLWAFLAAHSPARAPGARYEYSNLGVGLLGHVLARRAGSSYFALLQERVLDPLGITRTAGRFTAAMAGNIATGHDAQGTAVPYWDGDVLAGAGFLRASTDDMLRFLAANLFPPDGPLGRAIRRSHIARAPAGAPTMHVGLGWHIATRGERSFVWHNGGTGGFRSFLGFDAAAGWGVVVLTNTSRSVDAIGLHLLDAATPLPPVERRDPD